MEWDQDLRSPFHLKVVCPVSTSGPTLFHQKRSRRCLTCAPAERETCMGGTTSNKELEEMPCLSSHPPVFHSSNYG